MYASLNGLGGHVFLDSNCLINAGVLTDSASQLALRCLKRMDFLPVVSDPVLIEACEKIKHLAGGSSFPFDAAALIGKIVADYGIIVLPDVPVLTDFPGVNRADQPLVRGAAHYQGWILTGDLPLVSECRRIGVESRLPHDVIGYYETDRGTKDPSLHLLCRPCYPLGDREGFLFIRLLPDSIERPQGMVRTALHLEGAAWLRYSEDDGEWQFSLGEEHHVSLRTPLVGGDLETILVNIRAGRAIELRVASRPHPAILEIPEDSEIPRGRRLRFGLFGGYRDALAGSILRVSTGPVCISTDRWRILKDDSVIAPEPWEESLAVQCLAWMADRWRSGERILTRIVPSKSDSWGRRGE